MSVPQLEEQIRALDQGRAAVPTEGWHILRVSGPDATRWLQDLITADVERLRPGGIGRSLLLGPTGRIRADLLVLRAEGGFLLLQTPDQPPVREALAPYVLSSDVALESAAADLALLPRNGGWQAAPEDLPRVDETTYEAWRIRRGTARFPIDLDGDSLPAEGGLDVEPIIDRAKGCYLGQESVARVRNLGHPPRVVAAVVAGGTISAGEPVLAGGEPAGLVTSANGSHGLVRIRWDAAETVLRTSAGIPLERR